MGKNRTVPTLTETRAQKILQYVMLGFALTFTLYRIIFSVANKFIVYDGIWALLPDLLSGGAILSGAAYGVYMLFFHPQDKLAARVLRSRFGAYEIMLLVLAVWTLFSCASTASRHPSADWWSLNRLQLFDLLTQILIMFPVGCWLAARRDRRLPRAVLHVLVIGAAALGVYVIYRVFNNRIIRLSNGGAIGMNEDIALVLNCNQNTTGLWSYVLMFMSLCLLVTSKKWLKIPYIIALPVFFMLISMSQSRTSIIAMSITLGVAAGLYFFYRTESRIPKLWMRCLIAAGIAAAVTFAMLGIRKLMYSLYLNVSQIEKYLDVVDDPTRELDVLNTSSRIELWGAAFKSMFYDSGSFFFGITPVGVYSRMELFTGRYLYTHNQILEIGTAFGFPMMILFVVLMLMTVRDCFKTCFKLHPGEYREVLAPLGVFLLLLGNMMEATLLGFNYLSGDVFIILLGWIAARARAEKSAK